MAATFKFGYIDEGGAELPFEHKSVWAQEKTTGRDRLVIAPSSAQVELLLKLSLCMSEPYGVLYVLHTPRSEVAPGRYQSPDPLSRDELSKFLGKYRKFLEGDARHDLWIGSSDKSSLLVYDRHHILFAYGPLSSFKSLLDENGLREAGEIRLPDPHVHRYNAEFDQQAADLMTYWSWKHFPLQDSDRQ